MNFPVLKELCMTNQKEEVSAIIINAAYMQKETAVSVAPVFEAFWPGYTLGSPSMPLWKHEIHHVWPLV